MKGVEAQILDGANIQYEQERVMQCHAIMGPDDPQPLNFLNYFDSKTANEVALNCSRIATEAVLRLRAKTVDSSLSIPNASRIYGFIAGKLGMEPRGRLVYVEDMPNAPGSGVTSYAHLTSVVIQNEIFFQTSSLPDNIVAAINNFAVETVAAHELTHLAGAQDKVFFAVDEQTMRQVVHLAFPGSTLEDWPDREKGGYFEEGLATLVGSMHLWNINPDSLEVNETKLHKSSTGKFLSMPSRISNTMTGHHEYSFCALGIERLADLAPDIWDILMASRRYGAVSLATRAALRACIDHTAPGLFARIDTTNINNLDATMETTERIDHIARRQKR